MFTYFRYQTLSWRITHTYHMLLPTQCVQMRAGHVKEKRGVNGVWRTERQSAHTFPIWHFTYELHRHIPWRTSVVWLLLKPTTHSVVLCSCMGKARVKVIVHAKSYTPLWLKRWLVKVLVLSFRGNSSCCQLEFMSMNSKGHNGAWKHTILKHYLFSTVHLHVSIFPKTFNQTFPIWSP